MRFRLARLQAESSRNMYSEHGFEALMRAVFGQVCQRLMVVSYCTPGSAQPHAASAIWRQRSLGAQRVDDLAGRPGARLPRRARRRRAHELVARAHGVVRVLPAHRVVRLAVEVGGYSRADERHRLPLLLADLPLDEVDDLRVVHVEARPSSRRGASCRPLLVAPAARSNTSKGGEAHEPRARPAARELLLLPADRALKFVPVPRPVLEQPGLALHEVVDAHQVVLDRLDEARGALRPLVGVPGLDDVVDRARPVRSRRRRLPVGAPVPRVGRGLVPGEVAARPLDAVPVVEPAVEPDGRVERAVLVCTSR